MTEQNTEAPHPNHDRHRNRNRAMLVGLLLLSMLPLFAAIWLYYGAADRITGGQTNHGALIQPPAQLPDLAMTQDGQPLTAEGPRLWRLLFVPPTACDESCMDRIQLLRQLHRLLGRDEDRVIRVIALPADAPASLRALLGERFPRMELAVAPPDLIASATRAAELLGGDPGVFDQGAPPAGVLTVDPLGNVVFVHGLDQIGEPLLSDLKRVLRLSNIG
ncbi:MAG: hypothetical protein V2I63_02795 [Pseudomonadales bacterium]|jgi:hypothetical protein|nr:hypothetical protein [Pseudomonadales bacterium]